MRLLKWCSFGVVSLVLGLALAACGGGGEDGGEGSAKSGLEKSKIVITQGGYANEVVAQRLPEVAKRHGLEIEVLRVRTGADILTALLNGSADVTLLTFAHMFQALDNNQDVVAIASNSKGGTRIVAGEDVTAASGDFKALSALAKKRKAEGRPLVLAGDKTAVNWVIGTASLAKHGIDIEDFSIRDVRDPSLHAQLLARGAADLLITSEPSAAFAIVNGWGKTFHYPYDTPMDGVNTDWLAKREFVEKHPKTIAALVAAINEAAKQVQDNPTQAVEDVTRFAGIEAPVAEEALKNYNWSAAVDAKAASALAKGMYDEGLVENDWSDKVADHVIQPDKSAR